MVGGVTVVGGWRFSPLFIYTSILMICVETLHPNE